MQILTALWLLLARLGPLVLSRPSDLLHLWDLWLLLVLCYRLGLWLLLARLPQWAQSTLSVP